ncbi:MAG TPA: T9SS type A sorting domain-containing protein [Chitinophagaceae bacterium]|nr:T9SS type A sorting domain-containing protein [Chitinophagaceae bacterium]
MCFASSIYRIGIHSSIEEIEEGKIQLIPNPANDNVTVIYQASSEGTCNLFVSDITGKIVKKIGIPCNKNRFTFSVSDVKSGLYLVNVVNDNQSIGRSKFAIIR